VADLTGFVHDELNPNRVLSFRCTIINRCVGIQVPFKVTAPCAFTTFKRSFYLLLFKNLIGIFLFFFDDLFSLVDHGWCSQTNILNTFLAYDIDPGIFQFFYFWWNIFFLYFLILNNFRRSKFGHFHFWGFLLGRWRRRRLNRFWLFFLYILQYYIPYFQLSILFTFQVTGQERSPKCTQCYR